jgi:hypothetical protein
MFVKKMEDYCGARHEDFEHATMYKIVTKLKKDEYKNNNHIIKCDDFVIK